MEFHYLHFRPILKKNVQTVYIKNNTIIRPSTFYIHELFQQTKGENFKKMAMFVKLIICTF